MEHGRGQVNAPDTAHTCQGFQAGISEQRGAPGHRILFLCFISVSSVAQGNRRAYATSVAYFGLFTSEDSFSFAFDRSTGLAGSAVRAGGVGSAAVGLLNSASFA
jgi:hypothetical protein